MNTRLLLLSATMLVLTFSAVAQTDIGPEHSPYYGMPIARPAQLTGLWETSDGKGGAVGIDVVVLTVMRSPRQSFNDAEQTLHSFGIGLYRRSGHEYTFRWFSDYPFMTWDGQKLKLHLASTTKSLPDIDLNLTFDAHAHRWKGLFHLGEFDRKVVLRRPIPPSGAESPFVGTWVSPKAHHERDAKNMNCIHIAASADGGLLGWRDNLVPGTNQITYGYRLEAHSNGETIELVTGVDSPFRREGALRFRLSSGGKLIEMHPAPELSFAWINAKDDCSFQDAENVSDAISPRRANPHKPQF